MRRLQLRFMLVVLNTLDVLIHGASIQGRQDVEQRIYDLAEKIGDELAAEEK